MAKRKERVAPPPAKGGWDFRFATNDAVKGSEQICSAAASNARTAWERITSEPRHLDRDFELIAALTGQPMERLELR